MTPPKKTRSESRARLDRQTIIEAAVELIDEQGVQGLSMRRLGTEMGVEGMALYHYVSGREDILEAVVDDLLAEIPTRVDAHQTTSWQNYLQVLAYEIRRAAMAHPAVFPLAASAHPAAPWLRPPLRSIALVEHFLTSMNARGFDDPRAVDAYKVFTNFLVGSLLLEAAMRGETLAIIDEGINEGDADVPERDHSMGLEEAPLVRRMEERLSEDTSQQEFEIGLESLIDRIERSISR